VDYLPFETEGEKIAESVRLVLQPGLIEARRSLDLWRKGARRPAYALGFLQACPDDLPEPVPPHVTSSNTRTRLTPLLIEANPWARALCRVYSSAGQTWLKTVSQVLAKSTTQDLVVTTLRTVASYFATLRPQGEADLSLADLVAEAHDAITSPPQVDLQSCLDAIPELRDELIAMRFLSGLGYGVLRPVLRDTTASGSLLRRKLEPILHPILHQLDLLRGKRDSSPA